MPLGRLSLFNTAAVTAVVLFNLAATPAIAAPDIAGAAKVFAEAKAICDRDKGALWGRSLCGPIMLVDPRDRSVVANQADGEGRLKRSGSVFTGVLPESVIVANTASEWSGTRWTQLLWPLSEDPAVGSVTIAHELFHRIQPELKLTRKEQKNHHLDTFDGRYLLQLEWRALAKALQAATASRRNGAIADALLFRNERYRLFPQAAVEEGALEINEGIPEYTGVKLGLATQRERIDYALRNLTAFTSAPTFVRSFAYATGPAYGLLLDQADPGWRGKLGSGQRLDQLLSTSLKLQASASGSLQLRRSRYDDGTLRANEEARDRQKRAQLAALKARLVDGPLLSFPLIDMRYRFNPQTLVPLEGLGTVYPTMRLSDEWGVLEVESGGALIDSSKTVAAVSAVGMDASGMKGDGWRLVLNKGWVIGPGPRAGDRLVRRSEGAPR